jgi:hypothetical protein
MLLGSKIDGVLNTIDGDPNFGLLRTIQPWPQPVMNSEYYTGGLAMWGDGTFPKGSIAISGPLDIMLSMADSAGIPFNASFSLWLFTGVTDFGFTGGNVQGSNFLTPSYDFGAPVTESGALRPLYAELQTVLAKHGAAVGSGPPPAPPAVTAFPSIVMTQALPLLDPAVLAALTPTPISSNTPRGMEELGVGYGYVLYSTTLDNAPELPTSGVSIALGGMHDRALVMLRGEPTLVCDTPQMSCGSNCGPVPNETKAAVQANVTIGPSVDLLVENRGRSCYGNGMEIPTTGITRWVQANGRALPGYKIYPLGAMENVSTALAPLWQTNAVGANPIDGLAPSPAFYRGSFSIAAGAVADTYLNLKGWGKGMAYVNGHALARFFDVGPQYTHYCPAGFLKEGSNEVILFETLYAQSNRSLSFMSHHLHVPSAPCSKAPAAPPGFKVHAARGWYGENGRQHLVGVQGTMDVDACAKACVASKDHCGAFHVYMSRGCKGDCYIHTLPLGDFVPGNLAAYAYDREHVHLKTDESFEPPVLVGSSRGLSPAINASCGGGRFWFPAGGFAVDKNTLALEISLDADGNKCRSNAPGTVVYTSSDAGKTWQPGWFIGKGVDTWRGLSPGPSFCGAIGSRVATSSGERGLLCPSISVKDSRPTLAHDGTGILELPATLWTAREGKLKAVFAKPIKMRCPVGARTLPGGWGAGGPVRPAEGGPAYRLGTCTNEAGNATQVVMRSGDGAWQWDTISAIPPWTDVFTAGKYPRGDEIALGVVDQTSLLVINRVTTSLRGAQHKYVNYTMNWSPDMGKTWTRWGQQDNISRAMAGELLYMYPFRDRPFVAQPNHFTLNISD